MRPSSVCNVRGEARGGSISRGEVTVEVEISVETPDIDISRLCLGRTTIRATFLFLCLGRVAWGTINRRRRRRRRRQPIPR